MQDFRRIGSIFALALSIAILPKAETVGRPGNPIWAVQIDFTKPHDQPWTAADFRKLAGEGVNRVEINLNWADLEPHRNAFQFERIDSYLQAVSSAHLKLILIFWESVWGEEKGKNPPAWLAARDLTSDGIAARQPAWWDPDARRAYFDYVGRVIDHVKNNNGFGGLFADYGWLDAMWGPAPKGSHGVTGYAAADITEFHRWLPTAYHDLSGFNRKWNARFATWDQVPAGKPGEPLFALYQQFRNYSVESTYNDLSKFIRGHTGAPLFYYWGGGLAGRGGPAVLGNDPDLFFRAAKRWNATIVLDDADHGGLALLFGSMARSYQVPLLQEWTPRPTGLRGETPEWLGHFGLTAPNGTGEDFFIYPPPENKPGFPQAFAAYLEWRPVLSRITGFTPTLPAAIVIPTGKIVLSTDLDAFKDLSEQLKFLWRRNLVLPTFVTDQELTDGVVRLSSFEKTVSLSDANKLASYASLEPPDDSLEVTPTVDGSRLWLAIANTSESKGYQGALSLNFQAMHLAKGNYSALDARLHSKLPVARTSGKEVIKISLNAADLQVLEIEPARTK